ncbi:phosphatidate phosphatase PAH1-like [Impatiens glandulifera]|uniref:phosphatidate phosphatase PAH1-like n=1 Tax=Impatiens glandulifera TaxID=253017 RepID=UPI001FB170B7|nr:phosphatidate phosphatase PAH1-like [Impatiens glandulifera]
MNVVGKVGSLISQGVYSVATPFHPFGGAVDIIVVRQQDGTFRSTPWYVRFGKFQGVLKGAEKVVKINVNGVDADFDMFLDNSGEAYFIRGVESGEIGSPVEDDDLSSEDMTFLDLEDTFDVLQDENISLGVGRLERSESEASRCFYEFPDEELSEFGSNRYDNLDIDEIENCVETPSSSSNSNSEVVLVSVDGLILTAPITNSERNGDDAEHELETPQFRRVGSGKSAEVCEDDNGEISNDLGTWNITTSLPIVVEEDEQEQEEEGDDDHDENSDVKTESESESEFIRKRDKFKSCAEFSELLDSSGDEKQGETETPKTLAADGSGITPATPSRRWRLWRNPFRRVKTLERGVSFNSTSEGDFVDADSISQSQSTGQPQLLRTNVPTTEQIASLNLNDGQNMITFSFSTRVLGMQEVDAHMYLWKWNAQIVISDVDGTITKSDVLGQFMPLVGKDWTQSGVATLFTAIKENGYQLLFLSARAIVQAYLTRSFLLNLKQDGQALPNGPIVISPDGLFPSLFREVIRRAPHEFKIACLEDIKALFPPDHNPFYAGFGNRDTDELSYRKIGIAKGKIFIINPKGEVAINQHRIDVKTYTSLHTLVNDMFPPVCMVEQEDYNSWNFWKMPPEEVDS